MPRLPVSVRDRTFPAPTRGCGREVVAMLACLMRTAIHCGLPERGYNPRDGSRLPRPRRAGCTCESFAIAKGASSCAGFIAGSRFSFRAFSCYAIAVAGTLSQMVPLMAGGENEKPAAGDVGRTRHSPCPADYTLPAQAQARRSARADRAAAPSPFGRDWARRRGHRPALGLRDDLLQLLGPVDVRSRDVAQSRRARPRPAWFWKVAAPSMSALPGWWKTRRPPAFARAARFRPGANAPVSAFSGPDLPHATS